MDMTASQMMRRCVQSVTPSMSLPELERSFLRAGVWGFPVVDNDQVVGVVSRSDIVHQLEFEHQTAKRTSDFYRDANGFHEIPLATSDQIADRIGERMEHLTVGDVMHRQLFAVTPEQSLRDIAVTMVENEIHRVLVTREAGF